MNERAIYEYEREYMHKYAARMSSLPYDIEIYQLRALWTTFCIHFGLEVDTAEYDCEIKDLWEHTSGIPFDRFNNAMAELLA